MLVGLLYSRAMLSMGQIALAATFILEGNWKEKWHTFTRDRFALFFVGLFLIHVIGLIYTENFDYALKDLRIKVPLLFFPVILSSIRVIDARLIKQVNYLFILLVFSRTIAIYVYYLWNIESIPDLRQAFFHISHIRFSLMVLLSLALTLYYMKPASTPWFILGVVLCLHFLFFFFYFELITGLVISLCVLPLALHLLSREAHPVSKVFKYGARLLSLFFIGVLSYIIIMGLSFSHLQENKEHQDLQRTVNGNKYDQAYLWEQGSRMRENGNLVHQNVCFEELERELNKRSDITIRYFDTTYVNTEDVLLRYLTSRNLTKDSMGVAALSDVEINSIEHNVTNVEHLGMPGLVVRVKEIIWELHHYKNGENFNGHSLSMRLEFWKTGWMAWKRHFWTGVGTGDVEEKMQEQYELNASLLTPEWRFRSHNQFISIGLALGLGGFIYLVASLVIPFYRKRSDYFYTCFMTIIIISMFAEDTLETQIGVGFFAFFNSFYFFRNEST